VAGVSPTRDRDVAIETSEWPRACTVKSRELLIGAWLVIAGAIGCKDTGWTPRGSADVVLSEIKLSGAAAVAKRIDADESFGRSVMNGIATGDSAWLDVADKLTPASAAAAASLSIALASALPRSPARVLAVLGPKYPVEDVCGIPFLKPESTLVASYHDEAVAALSRVDTAALVTVRNACRNALDDARAFRLERIDPSYLIKNKPVAAPRRARKKPVKAQQLVTPQDTSSSR
jgi:hypothetical protein